MVKIVTDSSSDIPPRLLDELDIYTTPAHILFGRKKYRDLIDIETQQFYSLLEREHYHPLTTQASPKEFYQNFKAISSTGEDILCITLPPNLSALIESARQGAQYIDDVRIEIFNSQSVTGGQGLQVVQAAFMAKAGFGIDEIIEQLKILQQKTVVYAVAGTTDYLVRGGRISVARGKFASFLGINPVLEIRDGEVGAAGTARGVEAGIDMIIDLLSTEYSADESIVGMTLNSLNPTGAATLANKMSTFNLENLYLSKIGPTMGANVGPGAVGIAVIPSLPFGTK